MQGSELETLLSVFGLSFARNSHISRAMVANVTFRNTFMVIWDLIWCGFKIPFFFLHKIYVDTGMYLKLNLF